MDLRFCGHAVSH
jgi:hypothetical protein